MSALAWLAVVFLVAILGASALGGAICEGLRLDRLTRAPGDEEPRR